MKKLLSFVVAVAAILSLNACGWNTVETGHRGVQVRFGQVDEKLGSLPEGLYTYNPFTTSIIELDTRVLKKDGKANTYTRDIQQANITYVINYHLNPNAAHVVYREVGKNWDNVLVPQAVEGVMKQVVGTYDAVDLIDKRGEATAAIQKAITLSLQQKNVIVDRFEMVNIQYQQAFEHSVEQKMIAVQDAIREKNKTVQVMEEAKQTVERAKAEAESMRIRANALQSNPKLVEYEAVQKWDGKLPQYQFGNSTPFINLSR